MQTVNPDALKQFVPGQEVLIDFTFPADIEEGSRNK
jgi:hypothetical protein